MNIINKQTICHTLSILIVALIITSCGKDEANPQPVNEEEVITTMQLTFTDSADANNKITATFRDADGEGGNAPSIHDTINLAANKTYYTTLLLLNETTNPADTISNEVLEEADNHMVFFKHTGVNIDVIYNDKDSKNLPLGLSSIWKTKSAGTGKMQVILKHQQDVKNGTETPGETDVDISFETVIK